MKGTCSPALSVVVPVYNEAGNVVPLYEEIADVMHSIGRSFEIIFVNDGSTDTTLGELQTVAAREPRLRIVDLAGNFGEAAALCAGFHAARGDLVVTLDGDGQNDPRDIPRLLACLEQTNTRVVSGWRQDRQEGVAFRVWPSRLANRVIAAVTRIPLHDTGCGLKVYRRSVVEQAALPRGMNRFIPAIFGVRAAEVAELPVADRRRQHGQSHYGINRTLVVLRDLLALRGIIADPKRSERVSMPLMGAAAAGAGLGLWHGLHLLTWPLCGVALLSYAIWWNVHRFNRAQREGVYRVRQVYGSNGDATA